MANLTLDDSHKAVIGGKSTVTGNAVSIHAIPVGSVNALTMAIVDGSGNQITSFGGGTQYADGATQATPTGTVALGKNGSNVLHSLSLDSSGNLNVNVQAGGSSTTNLTQIGSTSVVTAGVNGTLAIGGNQAAGNHVSTNVNPTLIAGSDYAGTPNIQIPKIDGNGRLYVSTLDSVTALSQFPSAAALADATANPTTTLIGDMMHAFNGTTWDRIRTSKGSNFSSPTGIINTIPVGQYVSSPPSLTNNNFNSLMLDVNGNLLVAQSASLQVTLQYAAIAASSSGDNTLIAAVSSKKIYVYAFELSFSGTVNAKFTDGASGTNVGGLYYGVANAGAANAVTPPSYLWAGSTNTALIINLSAGVAVGGAIRYWTA